MTTTGPKRPTNDLIHTTSICSILDLSQFYFLGTIVVHLLSPRVSIFLQWCLGPRKVWGQAQDAGVPGGPQSLWAHGLRCTHQDQERDGSHPDF